MSGGPDGFDGFDGFDPDTGEFREPAPPPKPRVEYPTRASLRKQARKGGAKTQTPPPGVPTVPPPAPPEIDLRNDRAGRSIDLDATGALNRAAFGDDPSGRFAPVPSRTPAGRATDDTGAYPRVPASDDTGSLAWIPADDENSSFSRGQGDDDTATFARVRADDDTTLFTPVPARSDDDASDDTRLFTPVPSWDAKPGPAARDAGSRDDLNVRTDVTGRIALPPASGTRSLTEPYSGRATEAFTGSAAEPPAASWNGATTTAGPSALDDALDDPATGSFRAVPVGPAPTSPASTSPASTGPAPTGPREPARPGADAPSGASPIPRAVAALVALAGLLLVGAGVLQSTMWKPRTTITASLADPPSQPIVVSAPGLLGLNGTRVQVTASGASNKPVFVGIGRASDVMAYLGSAKRETVTGENGDGVLVAKNEGTQADLPDPGSVDVWVLSQRAPGAAGVSWPNVSGQYVVVAATDGSGPAPTRLTFTWTGAKPHSLGAALIAIGAVFVVCGLVLLIMLISRARLERLE